MKTSVKGKIVLEYLERFPKVPSLTLAKKIYKENKTSFNDVENVRYIIRHYKGQRGSKKKNGLVDRRFISEAGSRNPYDFMPKSHALPYEAFNISQSRILVISDLHLPYQDNEAIKLALQYGKEKNVNCILINGDLIDFGNISRFEPDWRHRSINEEFEAVRAFLKGLRGLFPKARIIFKYGNHDERWEKYLYLKAPEIFDCTEFQLEVLLKLGELKIETVKDKLPIKIGHLTVLHGHELQGGGGVNPARATFMKTIDNVLIGHCHRTSQHTEPTMKGDVIVTTSQGCLCGLTPMFARVNKWNLGFVYIEHDIKTGEYLLENKKIIKGKVY